MAPLFTPMKNALFHQGMGKGCAELLVIFNRMRECVRFFNGSFSIKATRIVKPIFDQGRLLVTIVNREQLNQSTIIMHDLYTCKKHVYCNHDEPRPLNLLVIRVSCTEATRAPYWHSSRFSSLMETTLIIQTIAKRHLITGRMS